ncbi:metallophosphoesterase [Candidatus Magnetoovum chiemensis]|nr:metallophosphoesterase [Candidatus Magnetoovum chiemensis]
MNIKRQIGIGDIHGCYDLTVELIENRIRFKPASDQLIFIGDYIDRGKQNKKVVDYVTELKTKYSDNIILLMGNHEYLAYNAFKIMTLEHIQLWLINGGSQTIEDYGSFETAKTKLTPFIEQLLYFYETPNYIFVHGGIPDNSTVQTTSVKQLLWQRNFEHYRGKHIIVGHTPHKSITKYNNATVIDTGAFYYSKLSAYDVLNDKIYEAF